ncbi:glycosyltransferase family 4 protein [Bacteroides sp. GM023]|uniref:glycosyltransferase family 4 protein n=1 Tax=Bacteroides sp. GM023 TaxID=2723058 RepID=UPI00168BE6A5|nr:glycosyltransferase family 4 protein [Bacteroides sp. GM023]MBD3589179.1 glycosyltransferase family 4 protein [Bacteroides sp. GM023]
MRILVNTPRLIPQGGVANHYLGLQDYWTEQVCYNPIGKKGSKSGTGIYRLPLNILVFIFKIFKYRPDVVLLNPSLSKSAVIRDMIFLSITKLMGCRVVVFFHGFDKSEISKMNTKSLARRLNRCKCIFVLAKEFANILKSWGVTVPIELTTTKVDDKLIESFDIRSRIGEIETILFLARITEEKGVFIALDAFQKLKVKYPQLKMRVVGDGPALEKAKRRCLSIGIDDVTFLGALSGNRLVEEYKHSDLYLFPTFHSEGMPTSVLEAMAFGLPVVTRPVGGVCDFFRNGDMGMLVDSLNPEDFAAAVEYIMEDKKRIEKMSHINYEYAINHFLASRVAKQIENILRKNL